MAVNKSPHSAVGWVFLSCPQLPEGGCTVRWRRGDRIAHVLAGRKVGATVADGQVLARLDVPESGWVDLAELRTRGVDEDYRRLRGDGSGLPGRRLRWGPFFGDLRGGMFVS